MIYSIVGTHTGTRQKALKEFSLLGEISRYVYSEDASLLEQYIDVANLFGNTVVVSCVHLSGVASSKEILVALLSKMESSPTIFLIDEPFADAPLIKKLEKVSKKFFNAQEEKERGANVFPLCDAFAARDKKGAWVEYMRIRREVEGEALQGALWWKFQGVWQRAREGRHTPFTLDECNHIGSDIMQATLRAHRGEIHLMGELERIILAL